VRAHHEYGPRVRRRDGYEFGRELERLTALYEREVTDVQLNLLGSHDSPRYRTMAGRDRSSYHLAVLLQATLPGAPCIYYGDEIGVEGGDDPDCRRAFPWDERGWDMGGLAWTQAVLAVRRELAPLRRGTFRVAGSGWDGVAFVRGAARDQGPVLVVGNAGDSPAPVPVHVPELAGAELADVGLPDTSPATAQAVSIAEDGAGVVPVGPRTGRILRAG